MPVARFHKRPKASKNRRGKARYARKRFIVPLVERVKIAAAYMEGGIDNTPPKLAARFNRHLETIYAIINSPAMKEIGQAMEQRLVQEYAEDVAERIGYEVKTKKSKAGAWIAMELAERWGAIPPKIQRHGLLVGAAKQESGAVQYAQRPQEERVKDLVMQLTEITLDRGRIFELPMPELDELKDEKKVAVRTKEKEHV